jgi:2-polyprenyl-3-methyl-5-hydroxy-6-metoxy-1,4-benzoquinol methylase
VPGPELRRRSHRGPAVRQRLTGRGAFDYTEVARSNEQWPDHRLRTLVTGSAIAWIRPESVIDPACGDGSIVLAADRLYGIERAWLSDVSQPSILGLVERLGGTHPNWSIAHTPIEQALAIVGDYDVMVLTEILEHLDDPDALLRAAATKARYLVASSPEMRRGQVDQNPEHQWMFDREGYRGMLGSNGWQTIQYTHLNFPTEYDFQIWIAERAA